MKTETIKNLVNNSDLIQIQKNVLNGFINRATQEQKSREEDRELIVQVAKEKNISEVVLSTDEVKIYIVNGKDEWEVKYPYRSIYLNKEGIWKKTDTVSPTFDIAYLYYLQNKHLGTNSQFVNFAIKMLEISDLSNV